MRDLWKSDLRLRILAMVLIAALSGISPFPQLAKEAMLRIGQTGGPEATPRDVKDLGLVAEHLPWQGGLWEETGHHALAIGDINLAVKTYKKAAALGDLSQKGYLAFGDAYVSAGNPHTAGQIWEAGIAIYGPSEDLLTKLAEIQRTTKDYPKLTNTLKALLDLQYANLSPSPDIAQTNYELGMLLAVQNPDSAPPYLLQAVELDPKKIDAGTLAFIIQRALPYKNPTYTLMAVGRELARQDRWDLSARVFRRATEIQPDYGESWTFLGEALQHLDDDAYDDAYENALAALETALALEPNSLSANILMALYWKRAGDPVQHFQYLTKAANINPENPAVLVDLGEASAILGDLETGYLYHRKAIELTYDDPAYMYNLVRFCIRYNYHLREIALPKARQAASEK